MKIQKNKTARGFTIYNFLDDNGEECSIQKSSAAEDDYIWLGNLKAKPSIMVSDAIKLGMDTNGLEVGHMEYKLPEEVHFTTRMHLSREDVASLIPILQKFVDTGELES